MKLIEISNTSNIKEENINLIDSKENQEENQILDSSKECTSRSFLSFLNNKEKKKNDKDKNYFYTFLSKYYFFTFVFLFSIIIIIIYCIFYYTTEPNFIIAELPWINPELNDRKYENYFFDNGLEVMLIQDQKFERDGGAIAIEYSYMDNPYDEGIASIATHLLTYIIYADGEKKKKLDNYYGQYYYKINTNMIIYSFDILNNGFKKFLFYFSQILNPQNISYYYDKYIDNITDQMDFYYNDKKDDFETRKNHLLFYLVYGLKDYNNNNSDIFPEGNSISLGKYNKTDLKKRVLKYIKKMINPSKIKIVFFSKYKFLISSKYMKKYFSYLTTMEKPKDGNENEEIFNFTQSNKSQIIYINGNHYDDNEINIIYYIEKIQNESYSELYYKGNYLNYIINFLKETKEGSLYHLLTNTSNYNIISIDSNFYIDSRSKLYFGINIYLNSLKNINEIIFITYQYIDKIIKEATLNKMQMDRYFEIKDIFDHDNKYSDKSFNTLELAMNNVEYLFLSKYDKKYFFYIYFVPWNEKDNEEKIKNESYYYFKQLKPENSVIVMNIRDKDKNKITCNETSGFNINRSFFTENNFQKTKYYDIKYKTAFFNYTDMEKNFDINNKIDITFKNNNYKTSHNESFMNSVEEESGFIKLNNKSLLNQFYFKRNTKFKLPKVYISLNLFHPYLRPLNEDYEDKKCYYFIIVEIFYAIKRKINEILAESITAGNEINFSQNENFFEINIFCYDDVAYKILEKIKKIIYETNWESTDFYTKNEIYKYEALEDYFKYDKSDFEQISEYYFYYKLKNDFFNKYEFFPEEFNSDKCIQKNYKSKKFKYLNAFIINGYIYGYFTEKQAENISNIFETNHTVYDFINILNDVNNNKLIENTTNQFIDWINEIKELEENKKIIINSTVYNISEYGTFGVSYIKLNEPELDISIFNSMLEKVEYDGLLFYTRLFKYKNIYIELLFDEPLDNEDIIIEWKNILDKFNEFKQNVDNIGNRYYYIIKNFKLSLYKQQASLKQRAIDEFKVYLYKDTIIDPNELMTNYDKEYTNTKINKEELNKIIEHYSNIDDRKRLDIIPEN